MIGWGKELIAPLSAAALKENPADPGVRALSARIAVRDGERQNIDDLTNALEQGGTDGSQLRIDVAATLLTQSQSKSAGDGAIAILDNLVHTDAAPLEAIALWAAAAQLTVVNWANMLPVLESGSARAPHNTHLLANLAGVHERLGHAAKAREYYDRIILVSDNPQERLWAQKQSDSPRLRQD
jgi:predicted RNA polymerase sigma factor